MKNNIITQFLSQDGNDCFLPELMTEDGTIVRLCPIDKTAHRPLYCSRDGRFFSYCRRTDIITGVSRRVLNQIKVDTTPTVNHRACHTRYPRLSSQGGAICHFLMAFVWIGPRPIIDGIRYECDHINGNMLDWRADNLQWVTPKENRRRARYLRVMRACGFDPRIFSTENFMYWFSMPFDEFKTFFNHYKND